MGSDWKDKFGDGYTASKFDAFLAAPPHQHRSLATREAAIFTFRGSSIAGMLDAQIFSLRNSSSGAARARLRLEKHFW